METHIIDRKPTIDLAPDTSQVEPGDFYGKVLRLILVGYLRPELKFSGLPALIAQINQDISDAKTSTAAITSNKQCKDVLRKIMDIEADQTESKEEKGIFQVITSRSILS